MTATLTHPVTADEFFAADVPSDDVPSDDAEATDVIAATTTAPGVPTRPPASRRRSVLATEGHPTVRPPAAAHLSDEQVAELGRELDAIRDTIIADRGASDAAYIRRVIRAQRSLEIGGRAALVFASLPPAQGEARHEFHRPLVEASTIEASALERKRSGEWVPWHRA